MSQTTKYKVTTALSPDTPILSSLSPEQDIILSNIADPVTRAEVMIRMLHIGRVTHEPSIAHTKTMADFAVEEEIYNLTAHIQKACEDTYLFNRLNSFDLLYFLHPNHHPMM